MPYLTFLISFFMCTLYPFKLLLLFEKSINFYWIWCSRFLVCIGFCSIGSKTRLISSEISYLFSFKSSPYYMNDLKMTLFAISISIFLGFRESTYHLLFVKFNSNNLKSTLLEKKIQCLNSERKKGAYLLSYNIIYTYLCQPNWKVLALLFSFLYFSILKLG